MLYCFLDTNIFQEFRPITEIEWLKELNATKVCLVVTSVVVSELDKHKTGNNNRLRKRARKAISFLKGLDRQSDNEIHPHVTLRFDMSEPKRHTLDAHNLSTDVKDDRLIAKAIEFRTAHATEEVAIVTEDAVVQFKAEGYGLEAPVLSEDYRLPHEIDPLVKKNRELESELLKLRNRQPKLRFGFSGADEKIEGHIRTTIRFEENVISEDELRQAIEKKRKELKYPRRHRNSSTGIYAVDYDILGVTQEQIDKYRAQVKEYLSGLYRNYLYQKSLYRVFQLSPVNVPLTLENSGSLPAEGIEISLRIRDIRAILAGKPAQFDHPTPPIYPSSNLMASGPSSFMIGGRTDFRSNRVNVAGTESELWNIEYYGESDAYLARCYLSKLNHNKTMDLDELYLIVDEPDNASAKTSITIEFEIIAENVIEKLADQLVVIINDLTP